MGQAGNPNWKKVVSGNPSGRSKKQLKAKLEQAIKEVEGDQETTLFRHLVKRAFESDVVLIALCRKLLPEMRATEFDINETPVDRTLSDDEIREILKERSITDDTRDALAV